jgi:hypothetical protein
MSIALNTERLELLYDFLAECHPFCDWNMPSSDEVKFVVTRSKKTRGHYREWKGTSIRHEIGISVHCCGWIYTLAEVMAHEMVHLHQVTTKPRSDTPGVEHNAAFFKLAEQVHTAFGFNPQSFC